MTHEEASRKAQELTAAQGTGPRTVSQYRIRQVSGDPTNLTSGWIVEARPMTNHLDVRTVAR
jgi:hypothetical protein